MSKERLVIKNFGPIESVDLELGKITILIGDNATGKSTIAKVLAVCRYFSYIVDYSHGIGIDSSFDDGLSYWGISDYLKKDTYIEYHCEAYKLHVIYEIKDWDYETNEHGEVIGKGTPIYAGSKVIFDWKSEKFESLLQKLKALQPWNSNENTSTSFDKIDDEWINWRPNSSFFEIDVKQVMENPFYFPTERGLQSVFSLGRSKSVNDSLYEQLADLYNISATFTKPAIIEPFDVKYKNIDGKGLIQKNDEDFISLQNSASGYQSTIPIVLVIKYYAEREKRYGRTYIVEEPETNLFPKRQKKLIEFFAETINNYKNQFIVPTHSPYILSALNNCLYASHLSKLKNKKQDDAIDAIINKKYWLAVENVSVYFLENGGAKNLVNKEEGLIDIDDLDSVSRDINHVFDELLQIEMIEDEQF